MNLLSIFFCIWWIITNDIACLGCLYLVGLFFYCSRNKNSRLVLLLPKHIYEGSSDRRISNVYFFSGVGSVEIKWMLHWNKSSLFTNIVCIFYKYTQNIVHKELPVYSEIVILSIPVLKKKSELALNSLKHFFFNVGRCR